MDTKSSSGAVDTNDTAWHNGLTVPTLEEIRHAQDLRQQIRERYLRLAPLTVAPWCVGCD